MPTAGWRVPARELVALNLLTAHPLVENDERPERLRVVALVRRVKRRPVGEDVAIQHAGRPEHGGSQRRVGSFAQRAAQPRAQRDSEALLRSVDDPLRKPAARSELEQDLPLPGAHLERRREREDPVDDVVVQHRRTHLETVGHRSPVDLRQDGAGQVRAEVERENRVQGIGQHRAAALQARRHEARGERQSSAQVRKVEVGHPPQVTPSCVVVPAEHEPLQLPREALIRIAIGERRHEAREGAGTQRLGQKTEEGAGLVGPVRRIAPEDFVPPVSAEDDLDVGRG